VGERRAIIITKRESFVQAIVGGEAKSSALIIPSNDIEVQGGRKEIKKIVIRVIRQLVRFSIRKSINLQYTFLE
jgi:hypothetical protein